MPSQQSTKSDLVTGRDVEDNDGLEMRSQGKESGTDADMQDMRMLGRTQQLNVSPIALLYVVFKLLTGDSAIFASSPPSASPVL
jgi:hypothetical protein